MPGDSQYKKTLLLLEDLDYIFVLSLNCIVCNRKEIFNEVNDILFYDRGYYRGGTVPFFVVIINFLWPTPRQSYS
jgi:hypothetical protein